jgi:hypothetical protein
MKPDRAKQVSALSHLRRHEIAEILGITEERVRKIMVDAKIPRHPEDIAETQANAAVRSQAGREKARLVKPEPRNEPLAQRLPIERLEEARKLLGNGDRLEHVAELFRMDPLKLKRQTNHLRC